MQARATAIDPYLLLPKAVARDESDPKGTHACTHAPHTHPHPHVCMHIPQARAIAIDPYLLLPKAVARDESDPKGKRPYMHYSGSLTTPPCSEKVDWFVMAQPLQVPPKQVCARALEGGDKRGVGGDEGGRRGAAGRVVWWRSRCGGGLGEAAGGEAALPTPSPPPPLPQASHHTTIPPHLPPTCSTRPPPTPQILDFMRYAGDSKTYSQNSRPVMPSNERDIDYYFL